jgi:monoamine oxidase
MIGILLDLEAYMGMSFIEVLREEASFRANRFYEITGGRYAAKGISPANK